MMGSGTLTPIAAIAVTCRAGWMEKPELSNEKLSKRTLMAGPEPEEAITSMRIFLWQTNQFWEKNMTVIKSKR